MVKNYFSLIIGFLVLGSFNLNSQKKNAFNSANSGAFNLSYGNSASFYSKSNINFVGVGYNFTLDKVQLWQQHEGIVLPDFQNFKTQQYNIHFGYNLKRGVNLSLGMDHVQYGIKPHQITSLTGFVAEGTDPVSNLNGHYDQLAYNLDSAQFQYQTNTGLSFINCQLNLIQNLRRTKNRNFVINAIYGIGAGVLYSSTDFNFGGYPQTNVKSLSGLGALVQAGLRFEFFRHIYIQPSLTGAFLSQRSNHTQNQAPKNLAMHNFGMLNTSINTGIIFAIKKKNCDCPAF